MRHRQWKKNFKKQRGFNPGILEDRKKQNQLIKKNRREINRVGKAFFQGFKKAIKRSVYETEKLADSMKEFAAAGRTMEGEDDVED